MIKTLLPSIVIMSLLAGCGSGSSKEVIFTAMPPELKDCRVFIVERNIISVPITIVRCPNSQTTAIQPKTPPTVTIDDTK